METQPKHMSSKKLMVMRLIHKLQDWDAEFKEHHYATVGLTEEEDGGTQDQEQEVLDEHDEKVDMFMLHLLQLEMQEEITAPVKTKTTDPASHITRQLQHILTRIRLCPLDLQWMCACGGVHQRSTN